MRKRIVRLSSAALLVLLFAGWSCSSWERQTYQSLAASKAVIDQAQVDYEVGTAIPHGMAAYDAINAAKSGLAASVQALATYDGVRANQGSASAQAAAQAQVRASLATLPPLITAVKALYVKPKAVTP